MSAHLCPCWLQHMCVCIPFLFSHRSCTLLRTGQACISLQERAQIFRPLYCHPCVQRRHMSVSGFLSCLSAALVALAGHRGWRLWGRWCKGQAAGHWLGSHLISARALGLWEMTTTGHTFIISMSAWSCRAHGSSGNKVIGLWLGQWLMVFHN